MMPVSVMDGQLLELLLRVGPSTMFYSVPPMWCQNRRCQTRLHDFISKMHPFSPSLLSHPSSSHSFPSLHPPSFLSSPLSPSSPPPPRPPGICSNFIPTSSLPDNTCVEGGLVLGGRTEACLPPCLLLNAGQLAGCPFVLAGCGALHHPSLSETCISGPPTLEGPSWRHISAKWSFKTVLTGPTSVSTGLAGYGSKQPLIFLPCPRLAGRHVS